MYRRLIPALTALVLITAPALQGISIPFLPGPLVFTEYDHAAPLAGRTYSWGDLRLEVPLYTPVVRAAIDKDLAARGWQLVASGGSVTIFGTGNVRSETQLEDFYKSTGAGWAQGWGLNGWGPGWKPFYGEDTSSGMCSAASHLVIDMFDTGSHRLLFRGVMTSDFSRTQKKNTKNFDTSLKKMFKKFPPKK
jgi:hypothetical protein